MKPDQKRSILFVVEQTVINGKDQFGNSNDLMLISQALRDGVEVYFITPDQLSLQDSTHIKALKLAPADSSRINFATEEVLYQQSLNYFLARPANLPEEYQDRSKIFFENAVETEIDATQIPMFNRAEPISLNDGFYEILMRMQAAGVYIQPDPFLNKTLGDKLAVKAIHYNQKIDGLDLLRGVDIANGENQISFLTGFESISTEKLGPKAVAEFYKNLQENLQDPSREKKFVNLLENKEYHQALLFLYPDHLDETNYNELLAELEKLHLGAQKCHQHHNQLGQDTVLKPASYFGGVGVKRMKGEVDISQIMQHFCEIFADIKADCIKRQGENTNLASLPAAIVQKRATEASFGDLRIVVAHGELQGIFVRVNPKFAQTGVGNISQGGHPESLFNGYDLSKEGVDEMIADMMGSGLNAGSDEVKRAQALYGLLQKVDFIKNLEIFKKYPIIGIDALLTKNADGSYSYGVNEINLTSPSGQTALMVFDLVYQHQELATKILQDAGIIGKESVQAYQILPDIFAHIKDDDPLIEQAKTTLLTSQELKDRVFGSIKEMINGDRNFVKKSLDGLQLAFEQHRLAQKPPSQTSPRKLEILKSDYDQEQGVTYS